MSSVTSTSATTPVPSTRGVRLQAQVGLCGCIPFHMSLAVYDGVWLFVPSKILANDTSFCLFNLQHSNSDQSQKQSVDLGSLNLPVSRPEVCSIQYESPHSIWDTRTSQDLQGILSLPLLDWKLEEVY